MADQENFSADELASVVAEHTTGDGADTETVFATIEDTMAKAYDKAQAEPGTEGAGGDQPRDPATGQFKAKPGEAGDQKPAGQAGADDAAAKAAAADPAKGDQKPGADETTKVDATDPASLKPPAGWSAEAKAEWDKLSPTLKAAVAKREEEVSAGFKDYGEKVKRFDAFDRVLAPRRQALLNEGNGNEAAGLKRLFDLSDFAAQRPVDFIKMVAQVHKIDLSTLAGHTASATARQPGAGEPAEGDDVLHPQIADLQKKVNDLLQRDEQARTASENAKWSDAQSKIDAFAADPKHPHFDAVRGIMSSFIASGVAPDLEQAYQMAVRAHPEVYQKTVAEQEAQRQREAAEQAEKQRKEAQEKAARALKAQGTVISRAGAPAGQRQGPRSIDQTMEEAFDRIAAAG